MSHHSNHNKHHNHSNHQSNNQSNNQPKIQVLPLNWCNAQANQLFQACQHHNDSGKKQDCHNQLLNYCENNVFTSNVAESFQSSVNEIIKCNGNQDCINKLNGN